MVDVYGVLFLLIMAIGIIVMSPFLAVMIIFIYIASKEPERKEKERQWWMSLSPEEREYELYLQMQKTGRAANRGAFYAGMDMLDRD